jgi:hypothetical protein
MECSPETSEGLVGFLGASGLGFGVLPRSRGSGKTREQESEISGMDCRAGGDEGSEMGGGIQVRGLGGEGEKGRRKRAAL